MIALACKKVYITKFADPFDFFKFDEFEKVSKKYYIYFLLGCSWADYDTPGLL